MMVKRPKAWPKSADPTKGLGAILIGVHVPDPKVDRQLPLAKADDDGDER
jgi:hypothetical protein